MNQSTHFPIATMFLYGGREGQSQAIGITTCLVNRMNTETLRELVVTALTQDPVRNTRAMAEDPKEKGVYWIHHGLCWDVYYWNGSKWHLMGKTETYTTQECGILRWVGPLEEPR